MCLATARSVARVKFANALSGPAMGAVKAGGRFPWHLGALVGLVALKLHGLFLALINLEPGHAPDAARSDHCYAGL